MTIDNFIKVVAPKLKMPSTKAYETYKGSELKLTGFKEVKGKPIEDHKLYKIAERVEIKVDHVKKLKLAWLRGGKLGVGNYLKGFLKTEDLDKVMKRLNGKSIEKWDPE